MSMPTGPATTIHMGIRTVIPMDILLGPPAGRPASAASGRLKLASRTCRPRRRLVGYFFKIILSRSAGRRDPFQAAMPNVLRALNDDAADSRGRIVVIYALLIAANVAAWAWALLAFHNHPVLLATCLLAYSFGMIVEREQR